MTHNPAVGYQSGTLLGQEAERYFLPTNPELEHRFQNNWWREISRPEGLTNAQFQRQYYGTRYVAACANMLQIHLDGLRLVRRNIGMTVNTCVALIQGTYYEDSAKGWHQQCHEWVVHNTAAHHKANTADCVVRRIFRWN